jgi:hypothetical protein
MSIYKRSPSLPPSLVPPSQLYHKHDSAQAERLQRECQRVMEAFPPTALIPSMKTALAHFAQDKE